MSTIVTICGASDGEGGLVDLFPRRRCADVPGQFLDAQLRRLTLPPSNPIWLIELGGNYR